ncbi:Bug family tripartite tricarboxylate transporter substrate binding protein [Rhodoplanes sp. Z2-YC6860]|uniref:Bug family tripartite tricarboxylate transporter substrate binding protein n=1 Tax=Rhodoplanes sp. Z2-YC6860 TaxID=674703 RepID=UPI00078EE886|nr:tripartite tricarboxylate transporter substrate binding protein [Rhodoplanes sp. Z2-YC6860]AMN41449.1 ABC transporter substrate-binding protein [Rhodoplanes sp. Z2-YC6860]
MKNQAGNLPSSLSRRTVLSAALALPYLATARSARADNWPDKPIKLLVPFAAGGNIDVNGRLMAARLSEVLGQQMVVENRVGGSGIIATDAVARSTPDGYTLLWASTNVMSIVPNTTKTPYDPVKDFAPISALGSSPQVLLVNSKVPAKTVAEFVAYAKAQKDPLPYGGGGGAGSASNLIMALFLARAELKMTSVGYRGTALALTDVIGGQIPTTFVPILEAYAQRTNPNIRILGVSGPKRSASMPDVPAIAETYPGFSAISWTGMLAPKGTPQPIIDRLSSEMIKATKDSKFLSVLQEAGIDPIAEGPEKFAEMIKSELPVWAKAVDIAGVKIQQ